MAGWFMVIASISSPLSVVILFNLDKLHGWLFYLGLVFCFVFALIGIISLLMALGSVVEEQKQNNERFEKIINEIRGLRDDIKNTTTTGSGIIP